MLPLVQGIVYGPVRSRRLGVSLGVNVLPPDTKVCNLNCAYCQYGWTRRTGESVWHGAWPTVLDVALAVQDRLMLARRRRERIDRLTVAGHGEPTLHPEFDAVLSALRAVRDDEKPGLPIAVLSNSTTADSVSVRRALGRIEERHMKLDAGTDVLFHRLNGSETPYDRVLHGLERLAPFVLQAMFVSDRSGRLDNTTDRAIEDWLRAVVRVHPACVHLYTIDRAPAYSGLHAVPASRLTAIAERVRQLGIPVLTFAERGPVDPVADCTTILK
jgi:wyosine [tRNA(Phe)-imidazoG37] synthetase (radical SAM superfamily)